MATKYDEEDAKFPAQAKKIQRARKQFIEKGILDTSGLAMMLGLPPDYLKQRALDENWSEIRFQSLKQRPSDATAAFEKMMQAEPDPLARHSMVADYLVSVALEFAKALSSGDLKHEDMSFLRSRIEAAKSLSEAAMDAVDLARKVRGIEEGTPSVGREEEKTLVNYEVTISPAVQDVA